MWYLFEPRSGSHSYDDDSTGSELSWDWKFFLFLPLIILGMFLIGIMPFLGLMWYFLNDVYKTLKGTVESGQLSYPFLAKVGVFIAIILTILFFSHPQNKPIKLSISIVLAIGFVLIFTVLPSLALCLHRILKIRTLSAQPNRFKPRNLYLILLGIGLVALIVFLIIHVPSLPPGTPPPAEKILTPTLIPKPMATRLTVNLSSFSNKPLAQIPGARK